MSTPPLPLTELFARFPDDAAAERWFVRERWPDGVRCPSCGSDNIQPRPTRRPQPYRCRSCRRDFSVKTDTVMHGSNLGCRVWAIAIYLLTSRPKGVSSRQLHRDLGISYKAAWHLSHRIRDAYCTDPELCEGPAEVDETYVGGLEKNKHRDRKLRAGRGAVGKTPMAGLRDRPSHTVRIAVVPDNRQATLQAFVRGRLEPGARLYTDEAAAYQGLAEYRHASINHGQGEYGRGPVHTNGIESFWALFKRGGRGTYHSMSPKHLHRYAREFEGRHNHQGDDGLQHMASIVRGMEGRRLTYWALTRSAGT